jgi:hypothetical protein
LGEGVLDCDDWLWCDGEASISEEKVHIHIHDMRGVVGGREERRGSEGEKLTICNPEPRPAPTRIWYPIHLPVEVVGENSESRPLPIAVTTPLNRLHGR